ncbi:MAG TPA: TetR/AcrR family transcriptional regulator [Candidatus Binataceae bacterium]|nr:TetR/AcrR family transcriptional regulator [Candidatus Binataceae bacterium]
MDYGSADLENVTTAQTDRRTRKRERTRQEIYDAAMDLFAKHSYESVTIDMICEAADVGRSTFFLHFPAKAGLLIEFSRRLADDFSAAQKKNASAGETLIALVREISARIEAQHELMLAMFREFILTPEAIKRTREKDRELFELIESILWRGQKAGEFSNRIHPRLATGSILSTAAAILSGLVFGDEPVSMEQILPQYLEMIFHGLGGELPDKL